MKTAKLIQTVSQGDDHFQQHYNLSDVGDVVVSQIWGPYAFETYIFPCDKDGEITDFIEMDGSMRGNISPHDLLVHNGYVVSS